MSTATVALVYVCYGAIVISIDYAMVVEHLLCLGMFDWYELCCGSMFKLKFWPICLLHGLNYAKITFDMVQKNKPCAMDNHNTNDWTKVRNRPNNTHVLPLKHRVWWTSTTHTIVQCQPYAMHDTDTHVFFVMNRVGWMYNRTCSVEPIVCNCSRHCKQFLHGKRVGRWPHRTWLSFRLQWTPNRKPTQPHG